MKIDSENLVKYQKSVEYEKNRKELRKMHENRRKEKI